MLIFPSVHPTSCSTVHSIYYAVELFQPSSFSSSVMSVSDLTLQSILIYLKGYAVKIYKSYGKSSVYSFAQLEKFFVAAHLQSSVYEDAWLNRERNAHLKCYGLINKMEQQYYNNNCFAFCISLHQLHIRVESIVGCSFFFSF